MSRRLNIFFATSLAVTLASAGGCWPTKAKQNPPMEGDVPVVVMPTAGGGDFQSTRPQDPVKTTQQFFELEMYELSAPIGAFSTNADFWKPFDETFLGYRQNELLKLNGFRIGKAPLTELAYLTDKLADAESQESSLIGSRGKDFELPMKRSLDRQDIFYFDQDGRMIAKSYEPSENIFALSFRQTPRTSDHVRLAIAPAVREFQERLTRGQKPGEDPKFERPQTFFELGIELDLGADECLVISAADLAAQNKLVVGRAFMIEERPAQLVEKVMVIIPRLRGELKEVVPQGRQGK